MFCFRSLINTIRIFPIIHQFTAVITYQLLRLQVGKGHYDIAEYFCVTTITISSNIHEFLKILQGWFSGGDFPTEAIFPGAFLQGWFSGGGFPWAIFLQGCFSQGRFSRGVFPGAFFQGRFSGGGFPGAIFQRQFSVGRFSSGNFPWGDFPQGDFLRGDFPDPVVVYSFC